MKLKIILLLMAAAGFRSLAGSVITSNLPANSIIINIAGNQDFTGGYDGDKAHWYSPGSTLGLSNLLQHTFQPGTYTFRIVAPADAAALFPALTAAQTNQIFTAWTFNSPWITSYTVFDIAAATNSSLAELFDGASGTNFGNSGITLYGSPQAAYDAAIANGSYQLIRTGSNGYDSLNFTNSYTITNPETLVFVIPDQVPGDNSGGVSVLVSQISGLSVNWFKVAGGGGTSSDGVLTIKGTAGQPDAGTLTDGTLTVQGGFWVSAVQTPGLPQLFIQPAGANAVRVFWVATGSYTLQTNGNLASKTWTAYTGSITSTNGTNSTTVAPTGNLFFRLKQ